MECVTTQSLNTHSVCQFGGRLVGIANKEDILRLNMFNFYKILHFSHNRRCLSASCTTDYQTVVLT